MQARLNFNASKVLGMEKLSTGDGEAVYCGLGNKYCNGVQPGVVLARGSARKAACRFKIDILVASGAA